jgi:hypothetical protein
MHVFAAHGKPSNEEAFELPRALCDVCRYEVESSGITPPAFIEFA